MFLSSQGEGPGPPGPPSGVPLAGGTSLADFFFTAGRVLRPPSAFNVHDISQPGLCSTHFFRTDLTLTHMTIQVTQLRLNSNPKFTNLTQLRLNSKPKYTYLTQLWLNSFESELSQIWLTTHHILPNWGKSCWAGAGGGSNVAVGWFFLCKVTDNCKILTFSLRKISDSALTQVVSSWLNSDSNDNQRDSTLTRLILDFHGRLDSDSTHLSQSRVKFDSRLMSRAQPCSQPHFLLVT